MQALHAFAGGFAGALVLTATHQILHQFLEDAPRMDLMGEEAIVKLSQQAGIQPPGKKLYEITMAGDILSNTIFYAAVGIGKERIAVARGTALGLAAGIGAVYLPKRIGLTNSYSDRNNSTRLMTICIYTLGGFVSGLVSKMLAKRSANPGLPVNR